MRLRVTAPVLGGIEQVLGSRVERVVRDVQFLHQPRGAVRGPEVRNRAMYTGHLFQSTQELVLIVESQPPVPLLEFAGIESQFVVNLVKPAPEIVHRVHDHPALRQRQDLIGDLPHVILDLIALHLAHGDQLFKSLVLDRLSGGEVADERCHPGRHDGDRGEHQQHP